MSDTAPKETPQWVFDVLNDRAAENVDKWGLQDRETLLLAMQEELGELTRATLEAGQEGGSHEAIGDELGDLGALVLQFYWRMEAENDE